MANVVYTAGDKEKAESQLRKAVQGYETQASANGFCSNHPLFITMLIDLSQICAEQGQEEAINFLKKAKDLRSSEGMNLTLLDARLCLANAFLYWKCSDVEAALLSVNNSSVILNEIGYNDHPYYARAMILTSQLRSERAKNEDMKKAVKCLNSAQAVLSHKFKAIPTITQCNILELQADLARDNHYKKECLQKASNILESIIQREIRRSKEEVYVDLPVLQTWIKKYNDISDKLNLF